MNQPGALMEQTEDVSLDALATGLQKLRLANGNPSYADICARIVANREQAGMSDAKAAVARSTIYDCFRTGRSRVNADLVAEIVRALTSNEQLVSEWRKRCLASNAAARVASAKADEAAAVVANQNAAAKVVNESVAVEAETHLVEATNSNLVPENPELKLVPTDLAQRGTESLVSRTKHSPQFIAVMLVIGLLANLVPFTVGGRLFGEFFPIFADMLGTAIVAMLLGPWWGVLVGVLTVIYMVNPLGGFADEPLRFAFVLVAVVAALIWGYGVRRFNMAESVRRFVTLNALVGVACSLVAVPLVFLVFDGQTMMFLAQHMTEQAVSSGVPVVFAVFLANLVISLADKTLIGFLAAFFIGSGFAKFADKVPPQVRSLIAQLREGARPMATV